MCTFFVPSPRKKAFFALAKTHNLWGIQASLLPYLERAENPFFSAKKLTWPFITFQQEKKFSYDPGDFLFFSFFCKWKSGRGGGGENFQQSGEGRKDQRGLWRHRRSCEEDTKKFNKVSNLKAYLN